MGKESNELKVVLAEFKRAMKLFKSYDRGKRAPEALIAHSNGMLSFEALGEAAVVRAEGEWHGRAEVSARILALLARVPPSENPLVIRYRDGKLQIGTVVVGCRWTDEGAEIVERLENPGLIDLLALDRTISRAEVHGTKVGKQISQAKHIAGSSVTRAGKLLEKLEITVEDLWMMVEQRIQARIRTPT